MLLIWLDDKVYSKCTYVCWIFLLKDFAFVKYLWSFRLQDCCKCLQMTIEEERVEFARRCRILTKTKEISCFSILIFQLKRRARMSKRDLRVLEVRDWMTALCQRTFACPSQSIFRLFTKTKTNSLKIFRGMFEQCESFR